MFDVNAEDCMALGIDRYAVRKTDNSSTPQKEGSVLSDTLKYIPFAPVSAPKSRMILIIAETTNETLFSEA